MEKEIRYCPEGHVRYELNPFTFSKSAIHSDKHYCPVCGERLEIEKYEYEERDYSQIDIDKDYYSNGTIVEDDSLFFHRGTETKDKGIYTMSGTKSGRMSFGVTINERIGDVLG